MHEAILYERAEDDQVRCNLCAHRCLIREGHYGICGVRQNIRGLLYTRVYGRPVAQHLDPIEKKPLYHFLPGSLSYSIATIGCNFRCGFCQNWQISQVRLSEAPGIPGSEESPDRIVEHALASSARSIAYTYTEPTIFMEYALDIAQCAREHGLKNVFVTNGFMTQEALERMRGLVDAANVDLKFYSDEAYRRVCSGRLAPVLDTVRRMKQMGIWVEVTTLLVPGENDDEDQLRGIAGFLAGLDPDIPWHISRFHPDFRLTDRSSTPQQSMRRALEIGRQAGIRYIYAGNVEGWGTDTQCHACGKTVMQRVGFSVEQNHMSGGACGFCSAKIPGIFGA